MSVQIQDLTKRFGNQLAVDQLSFSAKKGEILGFLGPNGAGKSTTMKMITGYLPPTQGQVKVCGFDPSENAKAVQQRIGYLPEHNPLYKDMYVKEYLGFVGRIHQLPAIKTKVAEMIEKTGLGREQNKKIGTLSKGYRQRVGLAQAMLHEPEVLILDEPTSGLDPNQLVDIRKLIKDLGKERTVIFSTHIMQEVQAICDRVLIINQGKIVANDTIPQLQKRLSGDQTIEIELSELVTIKDWSNLEGLKEIKALAWNQWALSFEAGKDPRATIFAYVVAKGWTLIGMAQTTLSVEDVFQELTRN
ncbi:MAG: gliding motility-associated ABC transporter ATP-binding subunit GldA [Saprospiraceae bacterium]